MMHRCRDGCSSVSGLLRRPRALGADLPTTSNSVSSATIRYMSVRPSSSSWTQINNSNRMMYRVCQSRLYAAWFTRRHCEYGNHRILSRSGAGFATQSNPPSSATPKKQTKEEYDKKESQGEGAESHRITASSSSTTSTSDPPIWTWIDCYLPQSWRPYARLARFDKPIGTWLLLWPCCWSTALAHPVVAVDHVALVTLFGLGALSMRGAGCTVNDLWDQDIDQAVARTRQRPLPAGDLTTTQAVQFLALQLATGCAVLVSLPHTWYCFQWGVASLPLVVLYPTTKRYFPYPQLVLGLCFNWGAWMGWAATYGSMDWATVAPLYLSGVTWTLVYDTLYAHQDKSDDAKLGLYSTALTFGSDEGVQRRILHGLAASSFLLWATAGYQAQMVNPGLFGAGITAAYGHLVWQIQTADLSNPHNLAERFRKNATTGALVYAALLAGHPPTTLW